MTKLSLKQGLQSHGVSDLSPTCRYVWVADTKTTNNTLLTEIRDMLLASQLKTVDMGKRKEKRGEATKVGLEAIGEV